MTATVGSHKAPVQVEAHPEDQHAVLDLTLPHGDSEITIHYRDAIEVVMVPPKPTLGQSSSSMKLTSIAMHGNTLRLGMDEESERDNEFQIHTRRRIQSSEHVRIQRLIFRRVQLDRRTFRDRGQRSIRAPGSSRLRSEDEGSRRQITLLRLLVCALRATKQDNLGAVRER